MINYQLHFQPPKDEGLLLKAFAQLLQERESGASGYYNLPQNSKPIYEETLALKERYEKYDTIVIIGIGGSSLGTKALSTLFEHSLQKKMIFLENPDPISLHRAFQHIDKDRSIFLLVSKSGKTIETLSIFKTLLHHFKFDPKSCTITITDHDSPLHHFAQEKGLKSFAIPHNVGGRFSVLSAVGVVPLTLAGLKMEELLQGAQGMVDRFFAKEENHILQKAAFFYQNKERYPINVLFSYGDIFEHFNRWYVQLWAESLGKEDNKGESVGLTPIGLIGAVDQHSFLQLIMQGPKDKSVTFLNIQKWPIDFTIPNISLSHLESGDFTNGILLSRLLNEECEATKESIQSQGVPVDSITLDTLSLQNIGELIVYYELLTSATGALLGINTYDQPGVELGKKILKQRLGHEK